MENRVQEFTVYLYSSIHMQETKSILDRQILNYRVIGLAILVLSIVRLVRYHWEVMTNMYPNEYREGAMLMTSQLLLSGGNPYALDRQPQYTNVYGIFYPLVNLGLAFFTQIDLPHHRIVSAIFMLAGCLTLYLVMQRLNVKLFYRIGGVGVFYGHSIYSGSYAYPNSLGVFLLLITIFIPWQYNYNRNSSIVSIFAGILGFLTKPYFILGILYLTIYLLFVDRAKAIKYSVTAGLSLAIVMVLINWQFPMYINNTLLIHNNVAGKNIAYMICQLQTYTLDNIYLVILGMITIYYQQKNTFKIKVKPINLIDTCLILSLLLFVTKLGLHEGAWISYLHHLVSPFAIISLFVFFSKQSDSIDCRRYTIISYVSIILLIFQFRSPNFLPDISPELSNNWVAIDKIIANHQRVLSTPIVAPTLLQQHKTVWDNGESEYFIYGIDRARDLKSDRQYTQYRQQIKDGLINKSFDLVVVNSGMSPDAAIDLKILSKFYHKNQSFQLSYPFVRKEWRIWDVDLYIPKTQLTD
jgi:hypothetical protein